ncbi:hypothetical protein AWB79_02191 [Caballeronia hypogeia]|uniref:Uncharacterized protein n=1 Tax=Caballeronia hypogeia TaxID=1777140 RepID=A0A158AC73_9BURK|nr:hypothetical protein AWB79_02191 [Caballeronia hypogeia]
MSVNSNPKNAKGCAFFIARDDDLSAKGSS